MNMKMRARAVMAVILPAVLILSMAPRKVSAFPEKPLSSGELDFDTELDELERVEHTEPETVRVKKIKNPNSGEVLLTWNDAELDDLKSRGWIPEGTAFRAPACSEHPVYRLYCRQNGVHLYTASPTEKDFLLDFGWRDEGTAWYGETEKIFPLHRLYSPVSQRYLYTINQFEMERLSLHGWLDEGTECYVR